jgi:glycosyltransferase involved in cell wall biosynthesis
LAGRQDDSGLHRLYSEAWVAAFPSSYEPFGIVALEAMATGVPCIAGNAGGLREVVTDGSTGLLVQPDNPEALGRAVRALIRDQKWAQGLAEKAKEVASREYSWDDIARKTLDVYDEVAEASKAGVREIAAGGADLGVL